MVKQDHGELENVISGIDSVTSNNTSIDWSFSRVLSIRDIMARRRIWISGFDPDSLWIRTSGDTLNFFTKLVPEIVSRIVIYLYLKKKKNNTFLHVDNKFFETKDFVVFYFYSKRDKIFNKIINMNNKYQIIGQWKKLNTTSRIFSFRLCIVRD